MEPKPTLGQPLSLFAKFGLCKHGNTQESCDVCESPEDDFEMARRLAGQKVGA